MIPHKEDRFVLPVIPFLLLIAAEFIYKLIKNNGKMVRFIIIVAILHETMLSVAYYSFDRKLSTPLFDLMAVDSDPH